MDAVIDLTDVWKRYRGGAEALRGVSFQVPKGEIFGLLGPNGAGKSTLVKILLTIVRASRVSGTMLGQAVGHKPTLKRVGYLPEHARFPEYLKGGEVIRYVAGLSGVSHRESQTRAQDLLNTVGMQDWGNKKMGTYSKGMKQRIGLAQALVNDPEIVFLDEPTDGVDPKGRLEMRNLLVAMREQGRTVFVNSHLLGELEMICDSVAIMDQGKIVRQGTITELTEKSRHYQIRVQGDVPAELIGQFEADGVEFDSGVFSVYQNDPVAMQPMLDALRSADVTIAEMRETKDSLEDLFMQSVGGHGVGAAVSKTTRQETEMAK